MARRICPVRLDAKSERPDRRSVESFKRSKRELLDHVKGPEFVVALLILLRAYVSAGRPDMGISTWGSYEEWSALVGALKFAGMPDAGEVRDELAERADPRAEYTRQFVTGFVWLLRAAKKLLTAKQAVDLMDKPGVLIQEDESARERIENLRNAALALLRDAETLNAIQLGILLRRSVGKVRDGCVIEIAGYRDKSTL
jgi:putative DNA primase/helicase